MACCSAPRTVNSIQISEFRRSPYIITGYRKNLTFIKCFLSIFQIHNETGNIWTHLLASLYWIHQLYTIKTVSNNSYDVLIMQIYIFGCIVSCFTSSIFHIYTCMYDDNVLWNKLRILDFIGIGTNIGGSNIPLVWICFSYTSLFTTVYFIITAVVSFLLLSIPFLSAKFMSTTFRTSIYASTAFVPLIEAIHSLSYAPDQSIVIKVYTSILYSYLFYGSGIGIYITRIPERWIPGFFDIWFHSHQVWHILVFGGQFVLYIGYYELLFQR